MLDIDYGHVGCPEAGAKPYTKSATRWTAFADLTPSGSCRMHLCIFANSDTISGHGRNSGCWLQTAPACRKVEMAQPIAGPVNTFKKPRSYNAAEKQAE